MAPLLCAKWELPNTLGEGADVYITGTERCKQGSDRLDQNVPSFGPRTLLLI
jgi:hypothetical protein